MDKAYIHLLWKIVFIVTVGAGWYILYMVVTLRLAFGFFQRR